MAEEIISRKDALANGLKHFYTGEPCLQGHIAKRFTKSRRCFECGKISQLVLAGKMDSPFRNYVFERESEQKAREAGESYYATRTRCVHGHMSFRYVDFGSCVECSKSFGKKRYQDKRDETREKVRAYYYSDRGQEKTQEYRKNNLPKLREGHKKFRDNNPEYYRAKNSIRRERLKDGERHTAADIVEIRKLQSGKCAYCRVKLKNKYDVDHIIPLSRGGSNGRRNLQILCVSCNRKKHKRDPLDYARKIGMLL